MSRALIFILTLIALAGCTDPITPYQPLGRESYSSGYQSEPRDDPHDCAVTFFGNERSSPELVRDYAYLRAAEITKERGFSRFAVLSDTDVTRLLPVFEAPEIDASSDLGSQASRYQDRAFTAGELARTPQLNQSNLPRPSEEVNSPSRTVLAPASRLFIECLDEGQKPKLAGQIYVADEIIAKLRTKYRIKPTS